MRDLAAQAARHRGRYKRTGWNRADFAARQWQEHRLRIDPRTTLLDCLREILPTEQRLRPGQCAPDGACERPAREFLPEH
jgi:hypothetical protein